MGFKSDLENIIMTLDKEEIYAIALKHYPKDESLLGSCGGVRATDKNAFERKIWMEGFEAALVILADEKKKIK